MLSLLLGFQSMRNVTKYKILTTNVLLSLIIKQIIINPTKI